ncbi:hypothetical protein M2347_000574 [Chryseobacterium sp. H1D6B]|uniref:hypothetical protein n=1 Tax=Chryseobacterium sp. H1D6B TaxID=2940588 RepID=UPI0015CD8579|nr:hypothetical protein [Chryseobacterium sp. H1D6B]MDH6250847.1 hypothetical protein [Chryseobacterium sp. H1D6B]
MKKAVIICFSVFFLAGIVLVVFFGKTTIKKNASMKVYAYEDSPFYKKILTSKNNVYLNIWTSSSPYSIERYEELIKDSTKIIYNLSLDEDSAAIKKDIDKFGLKNDVTLENYNYRKEILKKVYYNWRFSTGFIEISDYKTPMTIVFDKRVIKEDF